MFRQLSVGALLLASSVIAQNTSIWDPKQPLRVGYVLFQGFEPLDVFGPVEILYTLSSLLPANLSTISFAAGPVSARPPVLGGMLRIAPEAIASHSFDNAPEVDVLVVPGGMGTRWIEDPTNPVQNVLETFLAERAKTTKYMLSVCTGAVLLARSGVLDGKRATTNKSAWKYVTDPKHGKDVTWVPTARWVQDGNTWTSSGVAAGMDMMYAFLSYLYGGTSEGKKTVDQVMNIIEYAPHTDPHWDPFSVVYNVPGADKNESLVGCTTPAGYE